jgi:DNA-binding FadR family transcriptional regulator
MSIMEHADSAENGKSLVKKILDFVRERNIEPGERLPAERLLAERLGVGRNALREALATLVSLRVVEIRPNSGVYLRKLAAESSFETLVLLAEMGTAPTPAEVRETMEVRAPLERQAIALACERRTAEDLAQLRQILDQSDIVLAGGGNIADCDQAFHLALVGAAHNSVLVRMLNAFYCLTLPRRRVYFADPKRGAESAASHRAIVQALARRDARNGVLLMEQHLSNAAYYWREALGEGAPPARRTPRKAA